jgi:signal transduction histidine kinase
MAMLLDLSSLRGKITTTYVVLVVATLMLAAFAFLDLLFLERQVREGEVVSELQNAVLEMRREEKNLFLYGDIDALTRADVYAATSLTIIQRDKNALMSIMPRADRLHIIDNLNEYRIRLNSWGEALPEERVYLEDKIRVVGHQIYLSAESLASLERSMLEVAIQESQWFLFVFLLIIGLAIFIVGRQLRQVILTPLRKLEAKMKPVAEGRFNHLRPPSSDREFVAFTDAFNRMLKELEVRQRRMLQSEKLASLGILASGVAHELNNPLSNISSSCQLLLEELTEADPKQLDTWLKQIDSETERGRRIVRTLLDFGSQRVFERSQISLHTLLDETTSLIDSTIRHYRAMLTVNVSADITLFVDKQRTQQLFINLIQNALHAGGEGVNVHISAVVCEKGVLMIPEKAEFVGNLNCAADQGDRCIEILVSDDGPGIPVETLPKVFDPFFTTSEPGKGIGLGLFIVQEIVREHGGCLAIVSKPGEGTKVIMLLPEGDSGDV